MQSQRSTPSPWGHSTIPEAERIEVLSKRAFKILDPVRGGKKSVLWGVVLTWGAWLGLSTLGVCVELTRDV